MGHGGDGEASSGMGGAAAALKKAPKLQYIPVPDDPILANSVCPICQEKFETRWLDDAQEFVWPDAIKVGQRVYHASCHREAARDEPQPQPPARYARSTPEPVLGKRKAEVRCMFMNERRERIEVFFVINYCGRTMWELY